MAKKIGINGFGRIGRLVFRNFMEMDDLEVVAVNDIAPIDNLAYLLRYDSVHRVPDVDISGSGDELKWGGKTVKYLSERDPANLPWKEMGVDIVVESSGLFTKKEDAEKHVKAGASLVVISAPAKGDVATVCMGVNHKTFDPKKDQVVSNASCTTNCLAPVAKVLNDNFGIETGFLTTVHAVTASQTTVDGPHKKWRRGRSAVTNIVPTTTGAAIATTKVLPELEGKLDGMAMRVPVPNGSIIDFVARLEKEVTLEKMNDTFKKASESDELNGILGYTEDEIVSQDIIGMNYSSKVDGGANMVLGDRTVKVLSWYDNEWGYARRVADLATYASEKM